MFRFSAIMSAGHSKWSKIARGKGASDAARALLFTKLARAITAATKTGSDPSSNIRLASALDAARRASMPKDVVQRALAKREAAGATALAEGLLEGTGPGGTSLLISILSDNMRRTLPEIRYIMGKRGGELGSGGSQSFRFAQRGRLCVTAPPSGGEAWEEGLLEAALAAGAEDVEPAEVAEGGGGLEATVWCAPAALASVRGALGAGGFAVASAALARVPTSCVTLGSEEEAALQALLGALEDHADVLDVVHNAEEVLEGEGEEMN